MPETLDTFLSTLTPELNETFETLSGVYQVVIKNEEKAETGFLTQTFKNGDTVSRFQMCCDVTDVLKGNGQAGRRVWLRFNADEDGIKKLINNLFTAGLLEKIDRSSVEALKTSLPNVAGSTAILKAWGWTPDKTFDGAPIAEGDRKTLQQGQFITEKSVKKELAKKNETPF